MVIVRGTAITLAGLLALLALTTATHGGDPEPPARACKGKAFAWYGQCWSAGEGRKFVRALNRHGTDAKTFKKNYPKLAAIFVKPWPPAKAYWRTCVNGYRCAVAVLPHYFGAGWRYALAIVRCETGGTYSQHVVGSAGEVSWWQLHPVHFGWVDEARAVRDPRYATAIAYRMSKGGRDWSPWTCARYV